MKLVIVRHGETFGKKGKTYARFSFDFEQGKAYGELLGVFI